ncbi:9715_t:CDS:2, partial [Ambispora gerdemannii]
MNHMNEDEVMELANFSVQYTRDHPETDGSEVLQKYHESKQVTQLRGGVEVKEFDQDYTTVLKSAFKNALVKPREDYVD